MILHLVLALAAGDTARFHPADVDLYLETSNLRAASAAYADAPVVKTLADPAVARIGEVARGMGLDLGAILGAMKPEPDPARPDDAYWPWSALSDVSVSLSGLDAPVGEQESQDETAWSARASGWIVLEFEDDAAAAQAIEALSASVGITPAAPSTREDDPTTAPEARAPDTIRIDGHDAVVVRHQLDLMGTPMSVWLTRSQRHIVGGIGRAAPASLVERLSKPDTSFASRRARFVQESGLPPGGGVTLAHVWSDIERLSIPGVGADDGSFAGRLSDLFSPEFVPFVGARGTHRLQLRGDRFVWESLTEAIGAGREIDALYGDGAVPASTARFLPQDAVGAWLLKLRPAAVDEVLQALLVQQAVNVASTPASKASGSTPSVPDSAQPASAPGSGSAAPGKAASGDAASGNAAAPDSRASPELAGLGDSAAVFLMPLSVSLAGGGGVEPNVILALELKDSAAFRASLDAWIEHARKLDPDLQVQQKPYHHLPLYGFARGGTDDGAPSPAASGASTSNPTLTILPDRVLITASRKFAQSEIRRIEAAKDEPHALAAEGAIPAGAFDVGWMDWGTFVGKLYEMARAFLPMMARGGGDAIDPNMLPSAAELFRHIKPSTSFSTRIDGRRYRYAASSIGPETPLGALALAFGVSQYGSRKTSEPASAANVMPDVDPDGDGPVQVGNLDEWVVDTPGGRDTAADAKRAQTIAALRDVKTGLAVYRSQLGRVPDALDELVKGTDAFPKGFLESGVVPKDAWNRPLVYQASDKGAHYTLRSTGPNGIDDGGSGDDVSAP